MEAMAGSLGYTRTGREAWFKEDEREVTTSFEPNRLTYYPSLGVKRPLKSLSTER